MPEEFPDNKADQKGSLENLRPEERLRRIADMKNDVEREIERLKGELGRESDIKALRDTLGALESYEQSAREELRELN